MRHSSLVLNALSFPHQVHPREEITHAKERNRLAGDERQPCKEFYNQMNRHAYEQLRGKYGGFASWAIWDHTDRTNVDVIEEHVTALHARIVMVGLNISAPLSVPWSNFHIGRNDRKLEHAFGLAPYRGAYMTDLIKAEIEVNSATLIRRIRNGEINIQSHLTTFKEEMLDVGASDTTLFILFGGHVSELFGRFLGNDYPNHVPVQHYAVYGSVESWTAATLDALAHH